MLHWRHLIEVDDGEAVRLASLHIRHTEEEPLGVFVGVEVKAKVELIVPSATVTEEGREGRREEEREGGRQRGRGGEEREKGNKASSTPVYVQCHIIMHVTHTCTALPVYVQWHIIMHVTHTCTALPVYVQCHIIMHDTHTCTALAVYVQWHIIMHVTHTCTALARLPLSNLDSNTREVLLVEHVGVAFRFTLGPARARTNFRV